MDLRLNTMRRSINLSVCLVFDLEAGRFKFLGENLLRAGVLENELLHLSPSYIKHVVRVNAKPTKFPRGSKWVFKEYLNHF